MSKILFLLFVFSISLYSQGNFLINFYNRDFTVTKQEIISLFVKEPGVKITKDSANYFVIRGVKWVEFETKKIEIIFVDDTIGNFVMVIKDTLNLMKNYNTILNMMEMQFGHSHEAAKKNDEYFVHNRRWVKHLVYKEDSILQLAITKPNCGQLFIAYMNVGRLNRLFDRNRTEILK